jgi:hypothetical protein
VFSSLSCNFVPGVLWRKGTYCSQNVIMMAVQLHRMQLLHFRKRFTILSCESGLWPRLLAVGIQGGKSYAHIHNSPTFSLGQRNCWQPLDIRLSRADITNQMREQVLSARTSQVLEFKKLLNICVCAKWIRLAPIVAMHGIFRPYRQQACGHCIP